MKLKSAILSIFLCACFYASAQTLWQGPVDTPASWFDVANWVGGAVPSSSARIGNGGIAEISSGITNCTTIQVGSGDYGTLRVSGGILTNSVLYIGYNTPGGKLEAFGGDIVCPTRDLRIGRSSGVTGTVEITSGTVDMYRCILGDAGIGELTLSGGELISREWQSFIGNAAGSVGICTQDGGTRTFQNTSMYISQNTGSTGYYTLNDGTLSAANVTIGRSGNGTMVLNGGTLDVPGTVFIGYFKSATGCLFMNNYTNTFSGLVLGGGYPHDGGTGTVMMTGGDIVLNSARIGSRPLCNSTFVQNGGSLEFKQTVQLPSSEASGAATGALIISNNAETIMAADCNIYNGGSLIINDSDVSMKGFYVRGSDTCIEMNGGTLTQAGRFFLPDGTNTAAFHFNGGCLTRLEVPNQSYMFYVGGASANSGPGTFIQTGGVWTNETNIYLGRYSTNHVGRYEISGGTLESSTKELNIPKTRVAEFCVKGSAPVVNLRSINATTNEFLMQFILDKSSDHLAPINYTYERAYRCGHLRMGLDGGVVLSQTNEFTLMEWTSGYTTLSYDYLSRPDPNMWMESFTTVSPRKSLITLSDGYKQGALSIGGTTSASFAEHAMGHVTVANLSTNRLIGLVVRMAVKEQAKGVTNLVEDMIAAGYTNSVVESDGIYDLKLVIPPDCVVDSMVKTPSIFAWDFTDPTTGVTNATVTGVSFEIDQSPAMGTLFMLM